MGTGRIGLNVDHVEIVDLVANVRMGGFKGTAIKPTYLMRKATEVFGPCGEGSQRTSTWGCSMTPRMSRRCAMRWR